MNFNLDVFKAMTRKPGKNQISMFVPDVKIGDTRTIGTVTYKLNQNHRWERIDKKTTDQQRPAKELEKPVSQTKTAVEQAIQKTKPATKNIGSKKTEKKPTYTSRPVSMAMLTDYINAPGTDVTYEGYGLSGDYMLSNNPDDEIKMFAVNSNGSVREIKAAKEDAKINGLDELKKEQAVVLATNYNGQRTYTLYGDIFALPMSDKVKKAYGSRFGVPDSELDSYIAEHKQKRKKSSIELAKEKAEAKKMKKEIAEGTAKRLAREKEDEGKADQEFNERREEYNKDSRIETKYAVEQLLLSRDTGAGQRMLMHAAAGKHPPDDLRKIAHADIVNKRRHIGNNLIGSELHFTDKSIQELNISQAGNIDDEDTRQGVTSILSNISNMKYTTSQIGNCVDPEFIKLLESKHLIRDDGATMEFSAEDIADFAKSQTLKAAAFVEFPAGTRKESYINAARNLVLYPKGQGHRLKRLTKLYNTFRANKAASMGLSVRELESKEARVRNVVRPMLNAKKYPPKLYVMPRPGKELTDTEKAINAKIAEYEKRPEKFSLIRPSNHINKDEANLSIRDIARRRLIEGFISNIIEVEGHYSDKNDPLRYALPTDFINMMMPNKGYHIDVPAATIDKALDNLRTTGIDASMITKVAVTPGKAGKDVYGLDQMQAFNRRVIDWNNVANKIKDWMKNKNAPMHAIPDPASTVHTINDLEHSNQDLIERINHIVGYHMQDAFKAKLIETAAQNPSINFDGIYQADVIVKLNIPTEIVQKAREQVYSEGKGLSD